MMDACVVYGLEGWRVAVVVMARRGECVNESSNTSKNNKQPRAGGTTTNTRRGRDA
jgi:hypothetical protein